jgi:hypothetical protein
MKPTISNIVFIFLIATSTGLLTFLTAKGGLTNNRQSKFWGKLTKRGKRVFFLLCAMAMILAAQEINNQNSNKNKDLQLKQEQNSRDSIITIGINNGVDISSKRLFENLSKAFISQNLKIDTLQNTIILIKDSIKTSVVNNYAHEDPILYIDKTGIKLDSVDNNGSRFSIVFTSQDAGSTHFNIKTTLLTEFIDKTIDINTLNFFTDNIKIPKNSTWSAGFNINSPKVIDVIYLHVKGTYTTVDRENEYTIDDLYLYRNTLKKTSIVYSEKRDEILKLLEKNYP